MFPTITVFDIYGDITAITRLISPETSRPVRKAAIMDDTSTNDAILSGSTGPSSCWSPVVSRLMGLGGASRPARAVGLARADGRIAKHGGQRPVRYGMHDDAAEVRRRLEAIDGPVVVVAHSYGGLIDHAGGRGPGECTSHRLPCGISLDIGESLLGFIDVPPPGGMSM